MLGKYLFQMILFIIVLKQYDQQTHDIKKETFKSDSTLQLVIQREGALKRIYSKGDLLEKIEYYIIVMNIIATSNLT